MPPSPPLTPYRALFDHVLARLDAERAHRLGALALRAALPARAVRERAAARLAAPDPVLRVRTLGMELASPSASPPGSTRTRPSSASSARSASASSRSAP